MVELDWSQNHGLYTTKEEYLIFVFEQDDKVKFLISLIFLYTDSFTRSLTVPSFMLQEAKFTASVQISKHALPTDDISVDLWD